ncbi:glycosyltransferase family 2 protein [Polynucleobacter paneuropaeus]|nr:glycosyltransferase family 2 protein [Polynucleobacter paneuropaeus]
MTSNSLKIFHGQYSAEGAPQEIGLYIPENDKSSNTPEVSIVVPALNESITIGEFVEWCWEGLRRGDIQGEVIIVDSSSDETPHIALDAGARVLRAPKRGLGQAYIDSIPFIRSNFIVMGDCDLTYDFREVEEFVSSYRQGNEFVMGSRFAGKIEEGAMPPLHRYFGTPLTTWVLNRIYRSKFTDIHCGMRGLTKAAFEKISLTSSGWEYASEMVLKAVRADLKISEVPVIFYKDREGRQSHLKRGGVMTPWIAGWINLKVMLVYTPDSFLLKPGAGILSLGLLVSLLILFKDTNSIGHISFGIYTMMFSLSLSVLGYALLQAGILARFRHKLRSGVEGFIIKSFTYNRGMLVAILLFVSGFAIDMHFLMDWVRGGYEVLSLSKSAIFGLLLLILSIQTFSFTLLLDLERRVLRFS